MKNIFTEHPNDVGETYFEHLYFASKFGLQMLTGGLACIIHAVFPFLFKDTASNYLLMMTNNFVTRMKVVDARVMRLAESINKKAMEK